jgi:TPR repeat protein
VLKVFATPTFSRFVNAASRPVRTAAFALLAVTLLGWSPVARAQEAEEGTGFFSYMPAAPKLNLPNLDIPFWTDDLKKAKKAYNNGNFDRAIKFFRRASEEGNIVADWYLGHIYRTGRGVPRDDAMAFSYYSRVADTYDPDEREPNRLRIMVDAQLRVADYYRVGIEGAGIKANHKAAARSYLKIATAYGHPGAQYSLGLMNIKGQGVKKNPQQGLKWLIAAARKRHPLSEAYLGDLYWDGKLVQKDRTRGLMWYILAQKSAKPSEYPSIFDRYNQLNSEAREDERLEAEARARVFADEFPANGNSIPE